MKLFLIGLLALGSISSFAQSRERIFEVKVSNTYHWGAARVQECEDAAIRLARIKCLKKGYVQCETVDSYTKAREKVRIMEVDLECHGLVRGTK